MAEAISVSGPISGTDKTLTFETGKFAPQSMGAVVATIEGTKVLTTANAAKTVREGMDFFPLTVDVEERAYAAGKIPGSFFRREGRPTEDAILTCRLTDRPLRPSFPDGFRNETQIVTTVLGADQVNPHDVLSINAASAALMISGIPFDGPLGTVRMAYSQEGEWIPHPTFEEAENGTFEIVIAGRELADGDVAVMMVEAGGSENAFYYYEEGAKKVTEEVLGDALQACKVWIKESIALQRELLAKVIEANGPIEEMKWTPVLDYTPEIFAAVEKFSTEAMKPAVTISAKGERNAAVDAVTADAVAHFCGDDGEFAGQAKMVKEAVRSLMKKVMRARVLDEGIRIDGRAPGDLREITAEVGVLPTAHGSGLFQRGETQVMNVLTLAMPRMNQMIDSLSPNDTKRYLHHYNMPPWANGETGRVGSPKRREIGHGALAARAVLPVIPNQEDFAYTLRLVSEVMASNGSTSMGSVCSSSLSLMDAGVPVRSHVSGIAMGLIHEGDKYVTLTDILGAEDAMGDMDFKVAGTEDAITALQLDTKIDGLPADVLSDALAQARVARLAILDVMNACIPATRDEIAETAPKISTIYIPRDKIGEVIGPKGKIINTIQQETGADIAVDDDGARGIVTIGAVEAWRMEEAKMAILNIVDPPKAELGAVYMGRVVNITKFGAFVNILPGRDGLVHISKMGGGKRINAVEDVLELGQPIEVKVDEIDDKGKVSLTPTQPLVAGDGASSGSSDSGSSDSGSAGDAPKRERAPRRDREERNDDSAPAASSDSDIETVSFEDSFDAELEGDLGDLGPASERPKADRDNGNRRGGGGGGGNGGGSRRRHR